jgi:N-acetyl-gamma-glutamyl-phosphate reductase
MTGKGSKKIRVGIIGGAGYTAGELLRLLLHHPAAEIAFVQSNSMAGMEFSAAHPDLEGLLEGCFVKEMPAEPDLLFLCSGHGASAGFMAGNSLSNDLKIIDLSNDFRLKREGNEFVYGLPELNAAAIRKSGRIANPGCFATAIQLALLPLAGHGLLQSEVHVHAVTGSTGAGQQPTASTHFSWRDNNLSVYKAFEHQHLDEIRQSLRQLQPDFRHELNFIPLRGNFSRGIFASLYCRCKLTLEETMAMYSDYFQSAPFTRLASKNPSLKQVVNTNHCLLYLEKHQDKLFIISVIDNLLKGASGQAVQNMNLMFGLAENSGLQLKPAAF